MDAVTFIALLIVWGGTLVLAFIDGYGRGWDKANHEHRWHRWFVRREENRITKI